MSDIGDPSTILVNTRHLISGLVALLVTTIIGWRLFAKNKIDQIKDHEDRLRVLEKNSTGIKFLITQIDILSQRIDDIYILLSKK